MSLRHDWIYDHDFLFVLLRRVWTCDSFLVACCRSSLAVWFEAGVGGFLLLGVSVVRCLLVEIFREKMSGKIVA